MTSGPAGEYPQERQGYLYDLLAAYRQHFNAEFDTDAFCNDSFYAFQVLEKSKREGSPALRAIAEPIEVLLSSLLADEDAIEIADPYGPDATSLKPPRAQAKAPSQPAATRQAGIEDELDHLARLAELTERMAAATRLPGTAITPSAAVSVRDTGAPAAPAVPAMPQPAQPQPAQLQPTSLQPASLQPASPQPTPFQFAARQASALQAAAPQVTSAPAPASALAPAAAASAAPVFTPLPAAPQQADASMGASTGTPAEKSAAPSGVPEVQILIDALETLVALEPTAPIDISATQAMPTTTIAVGIEPPPRMNAPIVMQAPLAEPPSTPASERRLLAGAGAGHVRLGNREIVLLSQLRNQYRKIFGLFFDTVEFTGNDLYARSLLMLCTDSGDAELARLARAFLNEDQRPRFHRRKGNADLELTLRNAVLQ